jgi:PHD/YefM family antitoxin component YafN of YafNO toxin-antitoxin module
MPKIKPITELRNTTEISELCHSDLEPVFITKNGYGDLVVMSMKAYEQLIDMNKVDKAILESDKESNDELFDVRDALESLRRKHFG